MAFCSFAKDSAMFDSTPIENMFLLEYLPTTPDGFLRVYLYARMLCYHPEMESDIAGIAKALHMEEDAVYNAFHYWEQQGLVQKLSDRPATYAILSLHNNTTLHGDIDRDYYTYREYNSSLQDIFGAEDLLEPRHYKTANDWLNIFGYTQDAALAILRYEKSLPGGQKPTSVFKRTNERIKKWADLGIHTLERVNQEIEIDKQIRSLGKKIASQLSINRYPTSPELEFARRWLFEWHLSEQEIMDACLQTTSARNPNFGYLDAILKNKQDTNANQHFESVKAILQELGAANTTPTTEQRKKFAAFLESGFESETIMMAAIQCANKGWHTYDKLEWMLAQWADEKVYTKAQAEVFLSTKQQIKEELRTLYKETGMVRSVYPSDISLYESWKQKYSREMILCAAECALGTREPTKYMNKLLAEWQKSGISTSEAAKAQHAAYKPAVTPAAKPHHMNYQQRPATDDTYGRNSYSDPTKDLE